MGAIIHKKDNVSVQEFYEIIQKEFEGNNYNFKAKVTITIDDGTNPIHIEYITPSGFTEDQTKRIGRLEIRTE